MKSLLVIFLELLFGAFFGFVVPEGCVWVLGALIGLLAFVAVWLSAFISVVGAIFGFWLANVVLHAYENKRNFMVMVAWVFGLMGASIGLYVQKTYYPSLPLFNDSEEDFTGFMAGVRHAQFIAGLMAFCGYRLAALKRSSYGQDTTC